MAMSIVVWAAILGFLVVLLLRYIGCGWWSLLGMFSGAFLAVGLDWVAMKVRKFLKR